MSRPLMVGLAAFPVRKVGHGTLLARVCTLSCSSYAILLVLQLILNVVTNGRIVMGWS